MTTRWRYVLPNAITCLSIAAAMLAISEAIAGRFDVTRFDSAAWFILLCVLLDKADGTVARLLHASSHFGTEMDSLSDLLAFGVAPAVLMLSFLAGSGAAPAYRVLVYGGSFLFVIAAALRLAKFNVLTDVYGKDFFFGIPTTVSGAIVAAYFLTARKYGLPILVLELLPGVMIALALLMVSRVPFPKVGRRKTLAMNVFTVVNVVLVYVCGLGRLFPEYLLAIGVVYPLIGASWAIAKGVKPPHLTPPAAVASASPAPPEEQVGEELAPPAERVQP